MKYIINIQSMIDLITNSSSEVYTIHTTASADVVRDLLDKQLKLWGYPENSDDTIRGDVYEENGNIIVYYWMCNVEENLLEFFKNIFTYVDVRY